MKNRNREYIDKMKLLDGKSEEFMEMNAQLAREFEEFVHE
jgi:hypothetical protein